MPAYNRTEIQNLLADLDIQETPLLLIDFSRLRENCRRFCAALPGGRVFFAMKSNNDPRVLKTVYEEGLSFDVASWGEIQLLHSVGVPPERMMFGAPTKIPREIAAAYQFGVRTYAFDTRLEVEKLARLAPGSRLMARMAVKNEGSQWPLEKKFGMTPEQALELIPFARNLGLEPLGLTFHVGSQNSDAAAWEKALRQVSGVWQTLRDGGIRLPVINLGGGFPVEYHQPVPGVEEISRRAQTLAAELFDSGIQFFAEPGRGLVGDTGVMVSEVINRASRNGQEWVYIDAGVYHGLIEGLEYFGFEYPVFAERQGADLRPFVISGPTCDSADVVAEKALLPEDLTLGDRLYFLNCGAYSNSMEFYNGIPYPPVMPVNDQS